MKNSIIFNVENVDPAAFTIKLKTGGYSILLTSFRADFISIPLMEFSKHQRVGVTLEVPPAAEEETFITGHGLNDLHNK